MSTSFSASLSTAFVLFCWSTKEKSVCESCEICRVLIAIVSNRIVNFSDVGRLVLFFRFYFNLKPSVNLWVCIFCLRLLEYEQDHLYVWFTLLFTCLHPIKTNEQEWESKTEKKANEKKAEKSEEHQMENVNKISRWKLRLFAISFCMKESSRLVVQKQTQMEWTDQKIGDSFRLVYINLLVANRDREISWIV